MPYNLDIPGQVSEFELRAIENVARLVPKNGAVVEAGSLFGRSSWAWAKSVHPSVTVYCLDPWSGNQGIASIEKEHGIKYGIEEFKRNTEDCPNIVAKQGFSPADFQDWHRPIDVYYDDAVHSNPVFARNLEFWSKYLRPNGILCGDDYRPRFPDIKNGVANYARELGRRLCTVDFFWCLLPEDEDCPKARGVRSALAELQSEALSAQRQSPKGIGANIVNLRAPTPGRAGLAEVQITNHDRWPWPSNPADQNVILSCRMRRAPDTNPGVTSSTDLNIVQLHFDEMVVAQITIGDDDLEAGEYIADLVLHPKRTASVDELDEKIVRRLSLTVIP